ncbi:MAG: hypothetical protein ACOCXP_04525, partial [Candidatus Dojkabacteria bacterium]
MSNAEEKWTPSDNIAGELTQEGLGRVIAEVDIAPNPRLLVIGPGICTTSDRGEIAAVTYLGLIENTTFAEIDRARYELNEILHPEIDLRKLHYKRLLAEDARYDLVIAFGFQPAISGYYGTNEEMIQKGTSDALELLVRGEKPGVLVCTSDAGTMVIVHRYVRSLDSFENRTISIYLGSKMTRHKILLV